MKKLLSIAWSLALPCSYTHAQATFADPASVLVIVQDNTGPEAGTGRRNASQYVADYYMRRRGIPAGNIVHISTNIENGGGGSCVPGANNCQLAHTSSTGIDYANYVAQIAAPVKARLAKVGGTKIRYIVPTYGVPIWIRNFPGFGGGSISLDSVLAGIVAAPPQFVGGAGVPMTVNSYHDSGLHVDANTTGVIPVSRLDGRSAVAAAALVDKAIAGEQTVVQGLGYFDYQGLGPASNGGADVTMLNAYNECVAAFTADRCVLNQQQPPSSGCAACTGHMIQSAPNTLWAWGWYDLGATNAGAYTFAPGAVGSQLTSNSANCIRSPCSGGYVDLWLARGITATWGAVNEPTTFGYAMGDDLFKYLWNGYTFGEAAWLSAPQLNWMMVFVGDPLYRPSFAPSATQPAPQSPSRRGIDKRQFLIR